MENGHLSVLHPAVVEGINNDNLVSNLGHLAAFTSDEGDGKEFVFLGPLQSFDGVWGITADAYSDRDVALSRVILQLADKNIFITIIVAESGNPAYVVGKREHLKSFADLVRSALAEIGGEVRAVGGAAAVSENENLPAVFQRRGEFLDQVFHFGDWNGVQRLLLISKIVRYPGFFVHIHIVHVCILVVTLYRSTALLYHTIMVAAGTVKEGRMKVNPKLAEKIKNLKLIATDFDGVWTDGKVYFSQTGEETVLCSRKDTLRIREVKEAGIKLVVISKEESPVVAARCRKMGVECLQGVDNKLFLLKELLGRDGIKPEAAAYVGDDINDLECLRFVGFPITVADACSDCKKTAVYVTSRNGGDHAMREIFDLILSVRPAG